jgi:hypothetical protein
MPTKIITMYCFFDEFLKALGHRGDPLCHLSTAEVMTIVAVAAEFSVSNHQKALDFLIDHGYIPYFSKSRFNLRLHRIPETLWQFLLYALGQIHQQANPDKIHIVDTFPVPVCRNSRIKLCKIYRNKAFHGYCWLLR